MKFLCMLITLITALSIHAAAGPEAERAPEPLSDKQKIELQIEARNYFLENKPAAFTSLVKCHPEIICFSTSDMYATDLMEDILNVNRHSNLINDFSFYITVLLQQNIHLHDRHIVPTVRTACAGICYKKTVSEKIHILRINALSRIFHLFKSAELHPDHKTPNIQTPQQMMQHFALNYFTADTCPCCSTPRELHEPKDAKRGQELCAAVELD